MSIQNTLKTILPIASGAANFIPGLGPLASTGISMAGSLAMAALDKKEPDPVNKQEFETNYTEQLSAVYAGGGMMGKIYAGGGEFKQYDFPSHEKGGGRIDINGNPNPLGRSILERDENAFKLSNGNYYIYSSQLKFK